MNFSAREDIEAPIEFVFSQVSDFEQLERRALRRGAEVERSDDLTEPGPGMGWRTSFSLRGKRRKMKIEMVTYDPPNIMRFHTNSPNVTIDTIVELVALSRGRTRLSFAADVTAKNLGARLVLQSLKLAKSSVTRRFEQRMATYARELEDRYSQRS
ncbi:SRPBCC family protein [Roseovarius sp. LXJ103]|uniref:SRPBCC family protein n=1 Tax=Roseovarius carneus TaxID=2853164 RepID=UPI000D615A9B|nr:SRPBCC family protein [Roseovarius carneus]MBZ8117363.1 SRPBCC family protein [Roseovarius carneus]PWE36819.1 hypothetical protein DD563_13195 [Pelagicola sp. LXJ1103]